MPQSTTPFSSVGSAETVQRSFDFSSGMRPGEILEGSPTCVISVVVGTDATPQSHLVGVAEIVSSCVVTVLIEGMTAGVTYKILVTVDTTEGQTLACWALQPCVEG